MRIDTIIAKEVYIGGQRCGLQGMVRVDFKESLRVPSIEALREIYLSGGPEPIVTPFDGTESPFAVPVSFPVRIFV